MVDKYRHSAKCERCGRADRNQTTNSYGKIIPYGYVSYGSYNDILKVNDGRNHYGFHYKLCRPCVLSLFDWIRNYGETDGR